MVMTDPIADLLIRIKNGYLARKKLVDVPYSKIAQNICQILVKNGYLKKLKIKNQKFKVLELELKYEGKKPVVTDIKRISKPGLRVYKKAREIPEVKLGFGISVVSTPQGLMTNLEAKKKNIGGEILFQIW